MEVPLLHLRTVSRDDAAPHKPIRELDAPVNEPSDAQTTPLQSSESAQFTGIIHQFVRTPV